MKKVIFFSIFSLFLATSVVSAETTTPDDATKLKVSNVSTSSATLYINNIDKLKITGVDNVPNFLSDGYFKLTETNKVCIAIYPVPEECLPKQIKTGTTTANLVNLKPDTQYSAWFYRGNSIVCITTPCPTNEWQSNTVTFKTLPIIVNSTSTNSTSTNSTSSPGYFNKIKRDIWYRIRNDDVKLLQEILIKLGFLKGEATGYFGNDTLKAVKNYQRQVMQIPPTGKVGPLTRESLSKDTDEHFSSSTQIYRKEKENDDHDKNVSSSTKASSTKENNEKHDDGKKNGNKNNNRNEKENDDR